MSIAPEGCTDSASGFEERREGAIDDQSGKEEDGSGRREFPFSILEFIPVISIIIVVAVVVVVVDDDDDVVMVVAVAVGGGGGGRSEIEAGEKDINSDILFCFLRS